MAYNLEVLIDDFNGTAFAQAGAAEWGYIQPEWFLALPIGLPNSAAVDLPNAFAHNAGWAAKVGKNDWTKAFMKANYHLVKTVAGSNEAAYFIAALRLHYVTRGAIVNKAARKVLEDEYVFVAHQGDGWNHADNQIPQNLNQAAINKWIKRYGTCLLHSVAYMFVSRGHHYKQEYLEKYNKLADAQFIDKAPGFQLPPPDVLYRQAIHCFGVNPLLEITLADAGTSHMAAAMQLRWNPHSPVSGVAKITTSKAVLTEMKKESWWTAFSTKFQAQIGVIDQECVAISQNPYEYHVASLVVTGRARRMLTADSEAAFNRLSQFLLGYIDYLGRRHSLSGQVAITQKSGGIGPLAEGFSKACSKFGKANPTDAHNTMNEYLTGM